MELFCGFYDPGMANRPYEKEEDYVTDLYAYLDMCLSFACEYKIERESLLSYSENGGSNDSSDGLPVQNGECRVNVFLDENVISGLSPSIEEALYSLTRPEMGAGNASGEIACRNGGKSSSDVKMQLSMAKIHMMRRLAFTPGKGKTFRMRQLFQKFSLTKAEQFLLILSMSMYRSVRYEALFTFLQGEGGIFPTLRLAFSLYEMGEEMSRDEKARLLLFKGGLFENLVEYDREQAGPSGKSLFWLSKRVHNFLMGDNSIAPELEVVADYFTEKEELPPVLIREEWIAGLTQIVKDNLSGDNDRCLLLHLFGEKGNGRKFGVRQAARACGLPVLFVEIRRLAGMVVQEAEKIFRAVKLEYCLAGTIICFTGNPVEDGGNASAGALELLPSLDYLLRLTAKQLPFCIWLSEKKTVSLFDYRMHVLTMEACMLSVKERTILWENLARGFLFEENVDLKLCANKYHLTAGGIGDVLHTAQMLAKSSNRFVISQTDLLSAIKQRSSNQLGRYAVLINAVFTWEDLMIDQGQLKQLQMICNQIKYRGTVGEEWGFHEKTPYGRGICALFYGVPGTGKTMAVQVIANELGLDLYKVDLSQMISKYFGETQKNISELFQKARNVNALLFFDEADSMFARRSEVKGSNDRSANAETAHLLQKLEEYEGITVLATNYVNNIDDAFKRRIKFMVEFIFPVKSVRLKLWTSMLPAKAKCEEELDFEFYAEKFELSGSSIKEILTNAAFMAAAEHTGIANRYIVEAIRMNYAKYGKVISQEEFGYLLS